MHSMERTPYNAMHTTALTKEGISESLSHIIRKVNKDRFPIYARNFVRYNKNCAKNADA